VIQLAQLELDRMEDRSSPERWGEHDPHRDRRVYHDPERGLFVKVWGPRHEDHRMLLLGRSEYVVTAQVLMGFAIGFFDETTAPAFVDTIVDEIGTCRGYVSRAGEPFIGRTDPRFRPFLEAVQAATRRCGFAHTDVCYNNIVAVDGQLSFVDFDTVFSHLGLMDEAFERELGCLREHVYEEYRDFLVEELRRIRGVETAVAG
jgi:hypothetical protein